VNTEVLGLWAYSSLRDRQVMREFLLFPISHLPGHVNTTGFQRSMLRAATCVKQTTLHTSIAPTQSVRDITSTLSSSTTQTHSCTVETALKLAASSHICIAIPGMLCATHQQRRINRPRTRIFSTIILASVKKLETSQQSRLACAALQRAYLI
jgi:hypothetical protein